MNNGLPEFIENNLFSNHFLKERITDLEDWEDTDVEEVFDELKRKYKENKKFLQKDKGESDTQKDFIDFVLEEILGHYFVTEKSKTFSGNRLKPDYLFLEGKKKREELLDSDDKDHFTEAYVVADAKDWGMELDKGGTDHTNPAFQIYNYVDRTRIRWGILTNGRKWRLYSYEKCDSEVFYEIDLESLLEKEKSEESLEKFKFFYLLFRKSAFLPKEKGFADKVLEGSIRYSESLKDDLEDKVYDSLEIAVEGFFETNDLEKTEENIELIHHASLIFLYRLLFILNAESRGLLPVDDKAYQQAFGLMQLKEILVEGGEDDPNFQKTTVAWDKRISRLFEGINEGYDLHESKIPAYNGGLFDPENGEANKFLSENKLYGTHLKEILELLATDYDEKKDKRVILDYKDLNIRHLGSVYEGLLEHNLKRADERKVLESGEWIDFSDVDKKWDEISKDKRAEEGELYLTSDSGERKATGSYYTPEYIVEYIVKNTVGPKIEDKIKKAEEEDEEILDKIVELKVCDSAMGSGHFLTEATKFIADKIVENADLTKENIEDEKDITWAKRKVVQNCIYGVDINPLATELAKLSLWIETMSKGRPLSFLDHHLRTGNSLIGTDPHELSEHPEAEKEKEQKKKKGQLTLEDVFDIYSDGYDIQKNIKQLLKMYKNIAEISEEDVESIHEKEEIYRKLREHNFRKRFEALADVYTSYYFDNEYLEEDYKKLLEAFQPGSDEWDEVTKEEWIRKATDAIENPDENNLAEEKDFFHWKLEFPEVFFDIETGKEKDSPGFDAVIGNPPYARIQSLKENFPKAAKYYEKKYQSSTQNFDIYANFTEKGWQILDENGLLGYIEPHKFFQARMGKGLRKLISENKALYQVTHFGEHQVFPEASVYTCLLFLSKIPQKKFSYGEVQPKELKKGKEPKHYELEADYGTDKWIFNDPQTQNILDKIDDSGKSLDELTRKIFVGLQTSADKIYLLEKIEEPKDGTVKVRDQVNGEEWKLETGMLKPILKGDDVHRYQPLKPKYWVIFPYEITDDGAEFIEPETVQSKYPETWKYLKSKEDDLRGREGGKMDRDDWYAYIYPKNLDEFEQKRVITPYASYGSNFTYSPEGIYHNTKVYSLVLKEKTQISEKYLLSVLNNSTLWFFLSNTGYVLRGGYFTFTTDYINPFNIPEIKFELSEEERKERISELKEDFSNGNLDLESLEMRSGVKHDFLGFLADEMIDLNERLDSINLNIKDYLGNYSDGKSLGELYSPIGGLSGTVLTNTAADRDNLRIGNVEFEENGNDLVLKVSARYKPENEDEFETDQYGYTETDLIPAMRFSVDEKMKALIREFVPLAVDEAGGFADFRETATKTKSIIDRLEELILPKLEDVESGLEKFIENKNKAEELEEEIKETDHQIDAIVFDLYDLTEEEVETVIDSLDTPENERKDILEKFKNLGKDN